MKKTINIVLVTISILSIILLLWPFAMWNDVMLLILRIIPSFAIQIFLCRVGKYLVVKAIPIVLTGVLAIRGTYLYFTSPHWVNATLGGLITDYVSPFICCVIALITYHLVKKKK